MKKMFLIAMMIASANMFGEPASDAKKEEKETVQITASVTTSDENTKAKDEKSKETAVAITAQVLTAS